MYQKADTKELIGQRFGKLLVQEYSHFKNNKHYYKCLCDCGKTYISHRGRLLSGGSVSCGCDRPYRPDPKELIGKRFGRLIVLDDLGTDVSKNAGYVITDAGVTAERKLRHHEPVCLTEKW